VREKQLPTRWFYAVVALLWAFIYLMAIIGVIVVAANEKREKLYTRAGAWCWVNS
jgi:hypothetical protein